MAKDHPVDTILPENHRDLREPGDEILAIDNDVLFNRLKESWHAISRGFKTSLDQSQGVNKLVDAFSHAIVILQALHSRNSIIADCSTFLFFMLSELRFEVERSEREGVNQEHTKDLATLIDLVQTLLAAQTALSQAEHDKLFESLKHALSKLPPLGSQPSVPARQPRPQWWEKFRADAGTTEQLTRTFAELTAKADALAEKIRVHSITAEDLRALDNLISSAWSAVATVQMRGAVVSRSDQAGAIRSLQITSSLAINRLQETTDKSEYHALVEKDWLLGYLLRIALSHNDDVIALHKENDPASKSIFDEATRLGKRLGELTPIDRVRVLQSLAATVGVSVQFQDASAADRLSPYARATRDGEFPILHSKEVLPPEKRRAPGRKLWAERDKSLGQNPLAFAATVYKSRLGRGFTRADLAQADPPLGEALRQWLSRADSETGKRNVVPADIDLPSYQEWNDRRLAQLQLEPDSISAEEKARLLRLQGQRLASEALSQNS